jgi:hypothetical protein
MSHEDVFSIEEVDAFEIAKKKNGIQVLTDESSTDFLNLCLCNSMSTGDEL